MNLSPVPESYMARAQVIAGALGELPGVVAVVLSGSITGPLADQHSDLDIYVYHTDAIPAADRVALARTLADPARPVEIDNPYWGTEDAWTDGESGLLVELMYRGLDWIAAQLDAVLVAHRASVGYSTAFWYNVRHAVPLFDPGGWYARLQARAAQPYPDALRRNVIRLNHPLLRRVAASFRHQIELAIARRDRVSINHRVAALLASYFDVLFALNRQPHPGEKRLILLAQRTCPHIPEHMAADIDALLVSTGEAWDAISTLARIDVLLDRLDALLIAQNVITPGGEVL